MATAKKQGSGYKITVSRGYDIAGKQLRAHMTWTPKPGMTPKQLDKELNRQITLFEEKVKNGLYVDGGIKFADFAELWMKEYAEKQLAPATVAGDRYYLKATNKAIGHIKLDKLQPHHLMEFYNNLAEDDARGDITYHLAVDLGKLLKELNLTHYKLAQEAGVALRTVDSLFQGNNISRKSAEAICKALELKFTRAFKPSSNKVLTGSTITHYHRLISSILSTAVKWQVLISNPAERVSHPKIEHKEIQYLDETQSVRLIELLEDEPLQFKTAVILLLYSGLRRGELLGLEWGDFDFVKKTVSIRRTSQYLPAKGIYTKSTKTQSGQRVMKLPDVTFTLLKEYKVWQNGERFKAGDQWQDSDRLFVTWKGSPIHPDTLTQHFSDFIKRHPDLPQIHLHSLRHSNASLLIAAGTNVRTVSQRLGHAQTSTTMNIYSHAIQSADAAAAEALGDILNPSKMKPTKRA